MTSPESYEQAIYLATGRSCAQCMLPDDQHLDYDPPSLMALMPSPSIKGEEQALCDLVRVCVRERLALYFCHGPELPASESRDDCHFHASEDVCYVQRVVIIFYLNLACLQCCVSACVNHMFIMKHLKSAARSTSPLLSCISAVSVPFAPAYEHDIARQSHEIRHAAAQKLSEFDDAVIKF